MQDFLNEVTQQIKSKEAKKFVADELKHHINEAQKTWTEKGLTDLEAEAKSIEQMGSPTKLGIQMNKLHRPKVDWWMVTLLGVVLLLGFLPLVALDQNGYLGTPIFMQNKVIIVILGALVAVGIMFIDYRKWQKRGWVFYGIGVSILLAIRFLPNQIINGIPRIDIGPLTIENLMAVPFFMLAWASFFNHARFKIWQFIVLFIFPVLLFLAIPSVTSVYIYTIMVGIMLYWSQFSRKTVISLLGVGIGSVLLMGIFLWNYLKEYQKVRWLSFLKPEDYSDTSGYLYLRIEEFLSKAGWFGATGRKEFIPDAHTDFVFVTFTYYYGWLLAAALVLVLALFALRIVLVTYNIKDSYGKLLLVGAVALYLAQLATNVAMILGIFPLVGISLPFMSYGIMPTLLNAVLIGVVLSVYRRKDLLVAV
ncbi:FtsW/RodA/SpoVE family cell cycle protein [Neobacillus sp. D3-1R]|uniref:FtsW/RodA/SpoVE family cell cycle protein n=1 Tax=Neobacillus sp. D3-1R TaxID=3445778 RepID=UPI003F9FB212